MIEKCLNKTINKKALIVYGFDMGNSLKKHGKTT